MPIKIGDKVKELKYVQEVSPTLFQSNSAGSVEVIYGIDQESFRAVSGGFVFLAGHDFTGPNDVLVDDWAAKAKHLKVGDTYNLFNHDWNVVGPQLAGALVANRTGLLDPVCPAREVIVARV